MAPTSCPPPHKGPFVHGAKALSLSLLGPSVEQAIVLDADILALDNICRLYEEASALFRTHSAAVVAYAHEQTGHYMDYRGIYTGSSLLPFDDWSLGFNGGVGALHLRRLRATAPPSRFHAMLAEVRQLIAAESRRRIDAADSLATHLGDQTALTLIGARFQPEVRALIQPLPCEWNWQTAIAWYLRTTHGKFR